MKMWEAAVAVLTETDNPAVMWGDAFLLHLIANRAKSRGAAKGWKTERSVLNALARNPGRLRPGTTVGRNGRAVRIFRLPLPVSGQHQHCHAASDGECDDQRCPQPKRALQGLPFRHCPLDTADAEGDCTEECGTI
jgi:hypothetical protein